MHCWDSVAAMAFADEDLDGSRQTYDLHRLKGDFLHTIRLARRWNAAGFELRDKEGQLFDEDSVTK